MENIIDKNWICKYRLCDTSQAARQHWSCSQELDFVHLLCKSGDYKNKHYIVYFHGKFYMFCPQSQFTSVRKSFLYYRATLSQPSTGICGWKEEVSLEILVAKKKFRKAAQILAPVKGELVESHGAHEGYVWQLVVEQLPLLLRRVGNPQPS